MFISFFVQNHRVSKIPETPSILKTCIRYFFIEFLFFHQIPLKTMKSVFISSKKLFSISSYSDFSNFFPSFPRFSGTEGQMEVEKFIML